MRNWPLVCSAGHGEDRESGGVTTAPGSWLCVAPGGTEPGGLRGWWGEVQGEQVFSGETCFLLVLPSSMFWRFAL